MDIQKLDAGRLVAVLLITAGILGLAYGGFSYTRETHHADIGSIHLSVDDQEQINIPEWAGVSAIVIGGLLLIFRRN